MGKCFEQDNIFPIIKRVIEQVCRKKVRDLSEVMKTMTELERVRMETRLLAESLDYAHHDEIENALLEHTAGHQEVLAALKRCPGHSEEWMASNMIQWWSQKFPERTNEWARDFDRKEIGGGWAYRPRARK